MKKLVLAFFVCQLFWTNAQVPAYYSSIDFSQTGLALKNQLATLVTNTHTTPISYSDVWNVLVTSDLDPTNSANVLLAYGYNDSDASLINDRTRDKNNSGGSNGQWNREHTFAKSLGNPDLGTVGPGSDAHNLRASDVQMNADRGNLLYATGYGNAGNAGSGWYPGDEWKGDCARIIMYMYLRYGLQCRPIYACIGSANSVDANMVDLLLQWNASDDVSQLEKNRNNIIQTWQGNRNPFIDNPYIATKIWGGTAATDTWGGLGFETSLEETFSIYPIPASNHQIYVSHSTLAEIQNITMYDEKGAIISEYTIDEVNSSTLHVGDIPAGIWVIKIQTQTEAITKKIIVL